MAHIRDGYIVDIPAVSKKFPPNPLLRYDGHATAPASMAGSSSSVTQITLTHQLLLNDQRCLITGAVSTQIQACLLINTIRMNASNRAEKLPLKQELEWILTRQHFGVASFALDSLPNCIAMEAQWHGDLDMYGSFCITIPLQQIFEVTGVLAISNREWDNRAQLAQSGSQVSRNLDLKQHPYVVRQCTLLVLQPDIFLPDNRPVLINTARALRVPGGPRPPKSGMSSWIPYHSESHLSFLVDPSNHLYYDFEFKSLRQPENSISVFALLVNANSKLQNVIQTTENPILIQFAKGVRDAVDAIFHVPKEVRDQTPSLVPPVPALPSAHQPNIATPGPSSESGGVGDQVLESMDLYRQDGGVVEESHSDFTNEFEEYDCEEDDDELDTINGLTFTEMRTVLQRVSDGTISDRDRAESAMLMLGMAGGHQRPQALSPLMDST